MTRLDFFWKPYGPFMNIFLVWNIRIKKLKLNGQTLKKSFNGKILIQECNTTYGFPIEEFKFLIIPNI